MMSHSMSRPTPQSLKDAYSDQTRRLILASAIELLERRPPVQITARAVARQAGISERTVFRYFANREALLDDVAAAVVEKLAAPAPPRTLEELLAFPRVLFARFEANPGLATSALHSEIFPRIRAVAVRTRWRAVDELVAGLAPAVSPRRRRLAAANIRYLLGATAWHYYRVFFQFTAEEAVAAVEQGVRDALDGLKRSK